jgi:hypothetical protein
MSKKPPEFSSCCLLNLERIDGQFPRATLLTVSQVADWLQTTANNVSQMIKRGHFPFDLVRVGSRILFPVSYLSAWACGEFQQDQGQGIAINLPKNTPSRSRSKDSFKSRLLSMKIDIEARAEKIRKDDDKTAFFLAQQRHTQAVGELQARYEKKLLSAAIGVSERKKPAGGFTL